MKSPFKIKRIDLFSYSLVKVSICLWVIRKSTLFIRLVPQSEIGKMKWNANEDGSVHFSPATFLDSYRNRNWLLGSLWFWLLPKFWLFVSTFFGVPVLRNRPFKEKFEQHPVKVWSIFIYDGQPEVASDVWSLNLKFWVRISVFSRDVTLRLKYRLHNACSQSCLYMAKLVVLVNASKKLIETNEGQ